MFLKELERQKLQDTLHKDVMRKIIFLQRWFRAHLQRKEFLDMRQAAILIQVNPQQKYLASALTLTFQPAFFFKMNFCTNFVHFVAVKSQEQM